jgi:uncharacterized membrane protein YtjA (UPF0391 family)
MQRERADVPRMRHFDSQRWRSTLRARALAGSERDFTSISQAFRRASARLDHTGTLFATRGCYGHEATTPTKEKGFVMLYWAAVFFVIALIGAVLGFSGIAAGAAGIAKILFFVFLVLVALSLIFGRRVPA